MKMVIGTKKHHQDGRKNLKQQWPYKTLNLANLHLEIISELISSEWVINFIAAKRQSAHLNWGKMDYLTLTHRSQYKLKLFEFFLVAKLA